MKKVLCAVLAFLMMCSFIPDSLAVAKSAQDPMVSPYVDWKYGDRGDKLDGFIPAFMEQAIRPWELARWTGIFRFADGKESKVSNYDVFNIKKKYDSDTFEKENGFGLVYKSESALDELFQAIYAPYKNSLQVRQWEHLRNHFKSVAQDPSLKKGHDYYYLVDNFTFLRTSGIVQRLGIAFDSTKKISESERQALYTRVPFPKLTVKNVGSKMVVDYEASGFTHREIRVIAVPKGGWFGKDEAKITAIKTDNVGTYKPAKPVEMESNLSNRHEE
ncbi:hypothetical protein M5X05_00155, partial [Paenibacillus alvei]|nr:hypothetical protein [Paenibacillus alvei]